MSIAALTLILELRDPSDSQPPVVRIHTETHRAQAEPPPSRAGTSSRPQRLILASGH